MSDYTPLIAELRKRAGMRMADDILGQAADALEWNDQNIKGQSGLIDGMSRSVRAKVDLIHDLMITIAERDATIAFAASRPIVHFDDDHEECARELVEVQRKLITAKEVAASAEEMTRTYRAQITEQAAIRTAALEEAAVIAERTQIADRIYNVTEAHELADARSRLIRDRIRAAKERTR